MNKTPPPAVPAADAETIGRLKEVARSRERGPVVLGAM